jgi:hypothetical protein
MNSLNLQFTETNSADDSKGKTWGLEDNLFWYVTGGAFASVITLLLVFSVMKLSFLDSLIIAVIPLGLMLAYVLGFRQGKPPGYDLDCLDYWLNGRGFGPEPRSQIQHPLTEDSNV